MTKSEANKIINTLFSAIPDIYQGFGLVRDNMERKEKEAEKQHRSNRPVVAGFSVAQAAKYFTIKHLLQGSESTYTVEDMIDIRHEALLGQAYATRYAKELASWLEQVKASKFAEIDYSEMMK